MTRAKLRRIGAQAADLEAKLTVAIGERDRLIVELRRQGVALPDLADDSRLSVERVSKIVKRDAPDLPRMRVARS